MMFWSTMPFAHDERAEKNNKIVVHTQATRVSIPYEVHMHNAHTHANLIFIVVPHRGVILLSSRNGTYTSRGRLGGGGQRVHRRQGAGSPKKQLLRRKRQYLCIPFLLRVHLPRNKKKKKAYHTRPLYIYILCADFCSVFHLSSVQTPPAQKCQHI